MITHHKFEQLGGAHHGWLDAKHHFSFANYFDPKKSSAMANYLSLMMTELPLIQVLIHIPIVIWKSSPM